MVITTPGVTVLELVIVPDISRGSARASLSEQAAGEHCDEFSNLVHVSILRFHISVLSNARVKTGADSSAKASTASRVRMTGARATTLLGQRTGKAKQPYCFEVGESELFAFAGLWDRWKDPSGQWVKSCSILTTTPNAVTAAVHDRMPAILDTDAYDPVARPRNDECDCCVRTVEALRCPADALLSGEHGGQQCGERRRRMLRSDGTIRDSGSTILIAS
jgi:hypothetical protein